jgi:hypothetical protein
VHINIHIQTSIYIYTYTYKLINIVSSTTHIYIHIYIQNLELICDELTSRTAADTFEINDLCGTPSAENAFVIQIKIIKYFQNIY